MFVNLKNSSMFAVRFIVESGQTASNDSGFFISDCQHIGYNTPVYHCNGDTALYEWNATGKVISFFYFSFFNKHFYSIMRFIDDNVLAKNNSIRENTLSSAKTAPIGFKTIHVVDELKKELRVEAVKTENPLYQNKYLLSLISAFSEFLEEECDGIRCSEIRLAQKIEAARTLFANDKDKLGERRFTKTLKINCYEFFRKRP